MSTTVAELIKQIRINITDIEGTEFSDDQLIHWINEACRIVYNQIRENKPELLYKKVDGNTSDDTIDINSNCLLLSRLVVDGAVIPWNQETIGSVKRGTPKYYARLGNKLFLFPQKGNTVNYSYYYVPTWIPLVVEQIITLPNWCNDAIVEFVTIRAQYRNEADMSQELNVYSGLMQDIASILNDMDDNKPLVSRGYYE